MVAKGGGTEPGMMTYSTAFRASMVKRMTGRDAVSALALASEVGVSQATLSRWKREASSVLHVSHEEAPAKRAQDWTADEKLKAVMETGGLSERDLGAYLRRHGLHAEQLDAWRKEASEGARQALGGTTPKGKRSAEQKRIQALERDLRRKEKALAEATALLVLKKKLEVLFGDEEDNTTPENDE